MNNSLANQQLNIAPNEFKAWMIWLLGALFFFSHYIIRVFPASNSSVFLIDFGANQTQFGLLATFFYIPYLFMQMPAGALLDKYGSKGLISFAVLCCAFSTYLMSSATSIMDANISRLTLGIVSGFGFVGAIKLASTWFTPARLGLVVGITQSLGMLGAAIGNQAMGSLYATYGWREILFNFSLLLLVLCGLIFIFVRNGPLCPTHEPKATKGQFLINLKTVLKHPLTWINAFYAGLIFAPIELIGEVWGGQLMQTIHHTSAKDASYITSFVFYGWLIGGPVSGEISSWLGRKKVMVVSAFFGFVISSLILYFPFSDVNQIAAVCFLLGLTNGGLVASYTVASELHSKEATGLSAGLTNMMSVLIGAFMHPLIGCFIDWHWDGKVGALGEPIYAVSDFQLPLMIMPICALLAFFLSFYMKETLKK